MKVSADAITETIKAGAELPAFELHKFHKFEFIERFDEKVGPRSKSNPTASRPRRDAKFASHECEAVPASVQKH